MAKRMKHDVVIDLNRQETHRRLLTFSQSFYWPTADILALENQSYPSSKFYPSSKHILCGSNQIRPSTFLHPKWDSVSSLGNRFQGIAISPSEQAFRMISSKSVLSKKAIIFRGTVSKGLSLNVNVGWISLLLPAQSNLPGEDCFIREIYPSKQGNYLVNLTIHFFA